MHGIGANVRLGVDRGDDSKTYTALSYRNKVALSLTATDYYRSKKSCRFIKIWVGNFLC